MNEEYTSKIRAIELWDKNILNEIEVGTTRGLQIIHEYLFYDVFDFAGKLRNINITKGSFRFAPMIFLESNLQIIDDLSEDTFEEIVDKYVEMNVAHPFNEGNGRATRIWLDLILKKRLNKVVDWSKISKEEYLKAMENSPANTNDIRILLEKHITDDINNRDLYLKGVQSSYSYENLIEYDIKDIDKEIN